MDSYYKLRQLFYYKVRHGLLQVATGITKCDRIITNCDSLVYYKVRWTVITNCDSFFITKCDTVYYKLRQVLQSAMIITNCDNDPWSFVKSRFHCGKGKITGGPKHSWITSTYWWPSIPSLPLVIKRTYRKQPHKLPRL